MIVRVVAMDDRLDIAYLVFTFAAGDGDTRGGVIVVPVYGFTLGLLAELTSKPVDEWNRWLLDNSSGVSPRFELMAPVTLAGLLSDDADGESRVYAAIDRIVDTRECITMSLTMDTVSSSTSRIHNMSSRGRVERGVYQLTMLAPDKQTLLELLGMSPADSTADGTDSSVTGAAGE